MRRKTLEAVHTHTHTHTDSFNEIKKELSVIENCTVLLWKKFKVYII